MADVAGVRVFISNHSHLELIEDKDSRYKVRCRLTGHELPCRVSELETYTKGKKYRRLLQNRNKIETSWHKYKEFLVPNVKSKKHDQLFCKLTKKAINNMPHHIERHVNGKRFQRALAKYEKSLEEEETNEAGNMWVPSDLDSDSAEEGAIGGSDNDDENCLSSDSDEHRVKGSSANSDEHHKEIARGSTGSVKRRSKEKEEEESLPKKKKKTESKKDRHKNTKSDKNSNIVKQRSNEKHEKNFPKKPKQIRKKKSN